MATGRKGPSAPSSRKRSPASPDADGPPAIDTDVGGLADDDDEAVYGDDIDVVRAGPGPDDLVAIVRGLAAAVADHGLSELIIDTPDVTYTLRRGAITGGLTTVQPMQVQPVQVHQVPMQAMQAMPMQGMPSMPMAQPVGGQPSGMMTTPPPATAPALAPVEEKVHVVTSPFVGTFYRRPNPDAPEYVKVNDKVSKGQVLCIVEAMKLMNEIEADIGGTLVGVLAEDGAPVEYGQALFKIAPA